MLSKYAHRLDGAGVATRKFIAPSGDGWVNIYGGATTDGSVAKFEIVASADCHGCSERGSQALNLIRD